MKKQFNITGVCFPNIHYMMDNSVKINSIIKLVEGGNYFTINRPRQYGKTTSLNALSEHFKKTDDYLPIEVNFQGIDDQWHKSDRKFALMFMDLFLNSLKRTEEEAYEFLNPLASKVTDMNTLSEAITDFTHLVNKKLVLIIDEVDASSNFMPFINFLGMLRTKYLARFKPQHFTFHSIILAGVHDIKTLNHKVNPTGEPEYNSPWNIAADFKVEMSFSPKEIEPMLIDYGHTEGVGMNTAEIAERLHYYTSGHPFLISKLCKMLAEDILPIQQGQNTASWSVSDIDEAARLLPKENNTNFDSLIKKLEENHPLYQLVYQIIIEGAQIPFNVYVPVIHLGLLHGIFKDNGILKIHNRIYEQLIYSYMAVKTQTTLINQPNFEIGTNFLMEENQLDIKKLLLKFQQFMKEQYSRQDQNFLEREWRLIFLAFLKPIINGRGHDFKEVQISDEKRLDITISYLQYKYIVELKRWYGEKAHQQGIQQLSDYLNLQHLNDGYLLIFEYNKEKSWRQETITYDGKEIFAVWV